MESRRRAIIMGASSGMGHEVAKRLLADGWLLGLAARRTTPLKALQEQYPEQVKTAEIDITHEDAPQRLTQLIDAVGGMDLYFHAAGIGYQNLKLEEGHELSTVETNATGFTRLIGAAYRWMSHHGGGHIAAISSIAGVRGLGVAPAYSATKAFQNVYLQALEQQARMRHLSIRFTDIRPGFVDTALLGDGSHYPMLMKAETVANNIVEALYAHRHKVIIDWRYRLLVKLWRCVPAWMWRRLNIHT